MAKMKSKLSKWLGDLARGLKDGSIEVDETLIENLEKRAGEADALERILVLLQQNKDGTKR